jgi:hypothetical protein
MTADAQPVRSTPGRMSHVHGLAAASWLGIAGQPEEFVQDVEVVVVEPRLQGGHPSPVPAGTVDFVTTSFRSRVRQRPATRRRLAKSETHQQSRLSFGDHTQRSLR